MCQLNLHPEWRDSSYQFHKLRIHYDPAVIQSVRNSAGNHPIFALKKEHLGFWKKELRGRGLHNELNNSHFGYRNDPQQRCFGDPVAEHLEYILHKGAPYPGESDEDESFMDVERFCAVRISDFEYVVLDSTWDDDTFLIDTKTLLDPDFRPVEWFNRVKEHPDEFILHMQNGSTKTMGDPRGKRVAQILNGSEEYPGRYLSYLTRDHYLFRETGEQRFNCFESASCQRHYVVDDRLLGLRWPLAMSLINDPRFDVYRWYCKRLVGLFRTCFAWDMWKEPPFLEGFLSLLDGEEKVGSQPGDQYLLRQLMVCPYGDIADSIQLNGVQIPTDQYPGMQRNAARVRDPGRKVARPIVIVVRIDGNPVTALLDSGSLGTFMSTTLLDQLKFRVQTLEPPLTLQLAVQGSRSKINRRVHARFEYQAIDEERYFDVANINYPLILGTDWMYQHSVTIGFNPARVVVGSSPCLPLRGPTISQIAAQAVDVGEDVLERARGELKSIPLIDESLVIPWRPSRLPEKFREDWVEKRDAYIKSDQSSPRRRRFTSQECEYEEVGVASSGY
ncbi:hypothetical protein EV361DRAFT_675888 [Lentinula raphanica]|nr:hypothetical protein EV361DRAFT_675888 [Lentinula raphanica]